jgi:hypothetical protein
MLSSRRLFWIISPCKLSRDQGLSVTPHVSVDQTEVLSVDVSNGQDRGARGFCCT